MKGAKIEVDQEQVVLPELEGVKPAEILFEEAKAKKEARKQAKLLAS